MTNLQICMACFLPLENIYVIITMNIMKVRGRYNSSLGMIQLGASRT